MNINNKLYSTLNTMVDLFLLNLIWVITMLPLITFFPATAALFGVVRRRILQKESEGIFKSFFQLFKENCKQSFVISIIWSALALFLYLDYRIIDPSSSGGQLILYSILVIGIVLFSSITIYLFPIMVHFELNWKQVIRNAFLFSLMNPVLTILLLIIAAAATALFYFYPATIFIIGSFAAYAVYYLCQLWFNQLLNMKGTTEK
jgi:uncharacterized membrane protein YesL